MVKNNIFELSKNELDRSRELHEKAIFVVPTSGTFVQHWHKEYYDKLLKGGVVLYNLELEGNNFRQVIDHLDKYNDKLDNIGRENIIIAKTSEDVYRAKREGKVSFFICSQHGAVIERNTGLLKIFYDLGMRVFGLCYSLRNYIADGCNEITDAGLSAFGQRVVKKCNDLGMVIDLSHVGRQSSLEAIELSKDPVCFTHSNAMKVYRSRRNLYDDQIQAIGERNGVIGVNGWGPMVKQLTSNEDKPTLSDMLDHLDYMVGLVGVDHVGMGLDVGWGRTAEEVESDKKMPGFSAGAERITMSGPYEYSHHNWYVKELWDPEDWPLITDGLVARGYSDDEILKILGENFMRVFKAVWDK